MERKENVDIVILIPKDDEFKAFKASFDLELNRSDGELQGGKLYFRFNLQIKIQDSPSQLSLVAVFLNDQGNNITSSITEQILAKFDPTLIFLVGTAAGHEDKIKIGDIIISSLVIDASEWRYGEEPTPRTKQHNPPEKVLVDLKRYLGELFLKDDYFTILKSKLEELYEDTEILEIFNDLETNIDVKAIASSDFLHLNTDFLQKVWNIDDRIRCVDMESGGFGEVCKGSIGKQWLVVRGISDYGTSQSKREEYRLASSIKAFLFLKMFLEVGLKETHPKWIKIPESEETTLSQENFYTKYDIISFLKQEIKSQLGIDLFNIELTSSISLADLESICAGRNKGVENYCNILSEIREKYFTDKYLDYSYENDLRGLIPYWASELNSIFRLLTININSSVIIDVGIGNGLEIQYLFDDIKELTGVDISKKMLDKISEDFSWVKLIHNSAEDLHEIETNYADVYISLRTFQSSLLDIPQALREMQRVLKPRGIVILSIANGFVHEKDGEKKIIRGLLSQGSKFQVDKNLSLKIAKKILVKLNQMGFEQTGIKSEKTDVYIWGKNP